MIRTLRTSLLVASALLAPLGAAAATSVTPAPTVAPASLTAAPGNARVRLTWPAVGGAAGYKVFRAVNGAWEPAPIASTAQLTFTNWNLTNGITYSYRVAAYTKGGIGPQSAVASALPLAPPAGVAATAGDRMVTLTWEPTAGAQSYTVYRSTTWTDESFSVLAGGVAGPPFVDTGLVNKTRYYYRVQAVADATRSTWSTRVSAVPLPPPPASAPAGLTATPGNARVTLAWEPVPTATSYRVFRSDSATAEAAIATVTTTTFRNSSLVNGTAYTYRVAARNDGGLGPHSVPVVARPVAAPLAPATTSAAGGDHEVRLTWAVSPGAASYSVFRSMTSGRYGSTPVATGLTAPPFVDTNLENGPTWYYTVVAVNAGGTSPKSPEANATTEGPPLVIDAETSAAFRLLRQATWGPRPGDVEAVKALGADGFIDSQLAAAPSTYPSTLFAQSLETTQEHFMQLALTGQDQLRQRVAWALHKIWVVSAVEVERAPAIVTYQQLLLDHAFGNYRDLMKAVTLNPAMGRYLNMLNNRSQAVTGVPPNENYARELMQLFTLGLSKLYPDGSPELDEHGAPVPSYTEDDVKALARILTGWTFGDGDANTAPRRLAPENYRVPMEPVARYHDTTAKVFLGETFDANVPAAAELDHALDVIFNHPNVAPFVSAQLIKQLVTSNPSADYVRDIAAIFEGGGSGRGDLAAVVRAILLHPEAQTRTARSGKLSEPVLAITSLMRALGASVTDHPFMSDWAAEMGQKVFYPPSVFSYFSPGFRVRGTGVPPLVGPEFQTYTSVTALTRANFIGQLLGGWFGGSVTVDYTPFTSRARDAAALTDYCNLVFLGGRMSAAERAEIIAAVRSVPITSVRERTRTALYLTLVAAQAQVDW